MAKYHSMVSRRDFMKFMGIATASAGGLALLAPKFHDIDELTGSLNAKNNRPWWVKEVSNPTIEIDYSMMQRLNGHNHAQETDIRNIYYPTRNAAASALGAQNLAAATAAKASGYTYRSRALVAAYKRAPLSSSWATIATNATSVGGNNATVNGYVANTTSPASRGEPKWTGTPEEAALMVRAAMRIFGVGMIQYTLPDQNWRDHVCFATGEKGTTVATNRPIVFESGGIWYDTPTKLVVPAEQFTEISCSLQGSNELWRTAPSPIAGLANSNTFDHSANAAVSTWNFFYYLGYQCAGGTIGQDGRYMDAGGSAAVLAGLGETSRQKLYTLTPEYGAQGRLYSLGTDMPIAPTSPIDAGMWRFCHTCHKCANHCPPGAISQEKEPSYDIPSTNGIPWNFTIQGTKAFYQDTCLCDIYTTENGGSCKLCWANCTFTTDHAAMVHAIVRPTISTTSIFDTFFYKMGEDFGYGNHDPEQLWSMNLPATAQDSTQVNWGGNGYK